MPVREIVDSCLIWLRCNDHFSSQNFLMISLKFFQTQYFKTHQKPSNFQTFCQYEHMSRFYVAFTASEGVSAFMRDAA